jgi:hypothetical protein
LQLPFLLHYLAPGPSLRRSQFGKASKRATPRCQPPATEEGQYELKDKAGKTLDQGKYIVVWQKDGSDWKLLRDMFSSKLAATKKWMKWSKRCAT